MEQYVVQFGDTLSLIAKKKLGNENRWSEIAHLNNLQLPYKLFVGQLIKLPHINNNVSQNNNSIAGSNVNANNGFSMLQSNQETPTTLALARGFMFVVFEQLPDVGTNKIIRKVAVIPKDYSLAPKNPFAHFTLAQHARYGDILNTQFLSSSNKPFGAPSIQGKPLIVDVIKAQTNGARVFTVDELVADLRRFADQNPTSRTSIDQLIWAVQKVEGETLIQGGVPGDAVKRISTAHTPYVNTAEQLWAKYQSNKISKLAVGK